MTSNPPTAVIEWPETRRALEAAAGRKRSGFVAPDLDAIRTKYRSEIALATKIILTAKRKGTDATTTIAHLEAALGTLLDDEKHSIEWGEVIGLACVNIIRKTPSVRVWIFLWSLAWHSAVLEHGLPSVVEECAKESPAFKTAFVALAFKMARLMETEPGRRSQPAERQQIAGLRDAWVANPSLTDLWWGLRQGGFLRFSDDDGIFQIIANIDAAVFVKLLTTFKNPYPVRAALEAARAAWSFDKWKTLIGLAPAAFNNNGSWNGTLVAPLLLSIAWQCSTAARVARPNNSSAEIATKEISDLVSHIAEVVAARPDADPCIERWATWLMRQCLTGLSNEARPFPADPTSRGYVEAELIEALGKQVKQPKWNEVSPSDAEEWEPWCYRSVRVTFSLVYGSDMPGVDDFIEQWNLDAEEWIGSQGNILRANASLFETFGQRPDAYGARLLARPLIETADPIQNWLRLWIATAAVREAVEYISSDEPIDGGLGSQFTGGRLLRLAFSIGLMMMDGIIDPRRDAPSDKQAVLNGLFGYLASSAFEMRSIDQFDQGYWDLAIRHLALRRLVWATRTDSMAAAFDEGTKPTFADFIRDAATETEHLLALIDAALRNNATPVSLSKMLETADVDLGQVIAMAERLVKLDPQRSGIDSAQLSVARSVLDLTAAPPTVNV